MTCSKCKHWHSDLPHFGAGCARYPRWVGRQGSDPACGEIAPKLETCSKCGKPSEWPWHDGKGGVICAECAATKSDQQRVDEAKDGDIVLVSDVRTIKPKRKGKANA